MLSRLQARGPSHTGTTSSRCHTDTSLQVLSPRPLPDPHNLSCGSILLHPAWMFQATCPSSQHTPFLRRDTAPNELQARSPGTARRNRDAALVHLSCPVFKPAARHTSPPRGPSVFDQAIKAVSSQRHSTPRRHIKRQKRIINYYSFKPAAQHATPSQQTDEGSTAILRVSSQRHSPTPPRGKGGS
jgi:hypothetical protein